MNILTVNMIIDKANSTIAIKYEILYALSIGIFVLDLDLFYKSEKS